MFCGIDGARGPTGMPVAVRDCPCLAGEIDDVEGLSDRGREAVNLGDVQRSIQTGRTADSETVELSAGGGPANVDVENSGGILGVGALVRQDARGGRRVPRSD